MQGSDQQFGSWLRASTLNLAKKTVIRVAWYEEVQHEDEGSVLHSEQSEEEDGGPLNTTHGVGADKNCRGNEEEGRSESFDATPCEGVGPIASKGDRRSADSSLIRCMDLG